jgi:hypothetical protein
MPSSSGYLRSVPQPEQPVGGGGNKVFYQNDQSITVDYTIPSNQNAMTAGPISIESGVTVTVSSGATWSII